MTRDARAMEVEGGEVGEGGESWCYRVTDGSNGAVWEAFNKAFAV